VLSGVVALMIIGLVEWAVAAPLTQLAANYGDRFVFRGLPLSGMAAVVLASAGLGWLGAWLVASRHIVLGQPQ